MVQNGFIKRVTARGWAKYSEMAARLYRQFGTRVKECAFHHSKLATGAELEYNNFAGVTVSDKGKTAITLKCSITNGDDASYDTKLIIGHYLTNLGVAKDFVCTLTATMHTTAVTCYDLLTGLVAVTDFYCWNKRDYAPELCLVSNITIVAGDTLIIHTTGDEAAIWGTISAAATAATDAQLIGVGQIYGSTVANAADAGLIVTLKYWTPWADELKTAQYTIPADSSTVSVFLDTTTGYTCGDFFRVFSYEVSEAAVDELELCNLAKNEFYGAIAIGNYEYVNSRIFVPAASVGTYYIGNLHMCTDLAYPNIFGLYFQAKGCTLQEKLTWTINGGVDVTEELNYELEPLSEVKLTQIDDTSHHNTGAVTMRWIELSAT